MDLFTQTAFKISKVVTTSYSTSFSLATSLLKKEHRDAIYSIYGFVRFADEIVDTFHEHKKDELLGQFEFHLLEAQKDGISLNPILHAFQLVIKKYNIPQKYVDAFLSSMKADLEKKEYKTKLETDEYIYGSADVVGLMCLHVFCDGNKEQIQKLTLPAMRLGSAFQKVNFLRDLKDDAETLGRSYFPQIVEKGLNESNKKEIIEEIKDNFEEAYKGIKLLPQHSKPAVFAAYLYYLRLLDKLKNTPASKIKETRIRVPDARKILILARAFLAGKLNLI